MHEFLTRGHSYHYDFTDSNGLLQSDVTETSYYIENEFCESFLITKRKQEEITIQNSLEMEYITIIQKLRRKKEKKFQDFITSTVS